MKFVGLAFAGLVLLRTLSFAQETFVVTGTPVPKALLHQNYGNIPKGVGAFDLNICNVTQTKQSVVSSAIYQALSRSNSSLNPIGRQIMLASILRSQSRSIGNILTVALNSTTGILSVLASSKFGVPAAVMATAGIGAMSAQQILTNIKPMLTADQLENFDSQVLEPALVLDSGSCVERTVFTAVSDPAAKSSVLVFHVR